MTISNIKADVFEYQSRIVTDANGHIHPGDEHTSRQTLFHISTSDGHHGYSFGGNAALLTHLAKDILVGENPFNRELIWRKLKDKQRIIRDFSVQELNTIDQALWDLAGNILGLPVHQILGSYRKQVKAYASTMCGDEMPGGLSTPSEYAQFALWCKKRGYAAFKLHLWVTPHEGAPNWRKDLEACAAVRDAVGDDMTLMVDCSGGYSRNEAYCFGRELQKLGYYWLEEPMNEAEVQSYQWLCQHLDIFILGPETPTDIETRADWLVNHMSDFNRCGCQDVGGITPLIKAVHMFECFGAPFDIHMSNPGNLQVLGVTKGGQYYERGLLHPFIDYEQPVPYLNSIYDPMDANGYVHLPDRHGLGVDINFDYIQSHMIKMEE